MYFHVMCKNMFVNFIEKGNQNNIDSMVNLVRSEM